MAEDRAPTFEEYVALTGIQPRVGGCRVCELEDDVRENLGKFYAAGFRSTAMRKYLNDIGIAHISGNMLANHMTRGHSW